ncbi:MAG: c-type cytochrome [Methyloceanibacter sp.]|uniref:c-type cytochrome n=1 Tax=Methyloceanibacter sp. TaxID=1965321 RepID=UPI003D6CB62C
MRKLALLGLVGAGTLVALVGPAPAAGDAEKGKEAFAKCAICHQVGPDAQIVVGPPLNGVIGRKAGAFPDFTYSAGMKKLGDDGYTWTEDNIDKFIADPKALLPDSPMSLAFQGVPDADERANVIAYLKTQQ